MNAAVARAWCDLRFGAGMTLISAVCVVAHGLVLVHEIARGGAPPAPPESRRAA